MVVSYCDSVGDFMATQCLRGLLVSNVVCFRALHLWIACQMQFLLQSTGASQQQLDSWLGASPGLCQALIARTQHPMPPAATAFRELIWLTTTWQIAGCEKYISAPCLKC